MTTRHLKNVDPLTLWTWLERGSAELIDVREPDEFAREHIRGARLVPLSALDAQGLGQGGDKVGVFQCRTGNRTAKAAGRLVTAGFREIYHLTGGIEAWKAAGLPVEAGR